MTKKKNRRVEDKAKKAAAKVVSKEPAPGERREVITMNRAPADLDLSDDTSWFLIYTSPRGEARALAGLEEAGCSTFWPSRHKTVTVGKRVTFDGDVATFPRYLFATGQILTGEGERREFVVRGRPISSVFDIECVQDVASGARGWARVPNSALRRIVEYQNAIEAPTPMKPEPRFRNGQAAIIMSGPFMHLQATIVDCLGLREARVLIDVFGGSVRATISEASLRAA